MVRLLLLGSPPSPLCADPVLEGLRGPQAPGVAESDVAAQVSRGDAQLASRHLARLPSVRPSLSLFLSCSLSPDARPRRSLGVKLVSRAYLRLMRERFGSLLALLETVGCNCGDASAGCPPGLSALTLAQLNAVPSQVLCCVSLIASAVLACHRFSLLASVGLYLGGHCERGRRQCGLLWHHRGRQGLPQLAHLVHRHQEAPDDRQHRAPPAPACLPASELLSDPACLAADGELRDRDE